MIKYHIKKGSIVIYVLLVFLFIFSILTFVVYKLNRKLDYTTYKNQTENLYYLASSGSEKLLNILNNFINNELPNETILEWESKDLSTISNYEIASLDNLYNGSFFMEKNNIDNFVNNKIIDYLNDNYIKKNNKYEFDYNISFSKNKKFNVKVNFSLDKNKNHFTFESHAKNIETNNNLIMEGIIENNNNTEMIITEKYIPKNNFSHFDFGLASKNKIIKDNNLTTIYGSYLEKYVLQDLINDSVILYNKEYHKNNPVIITNNTKQININDFNNNKVIIINNSNETLYIEGTQSENILNGIIYSKGDIIINCNLTLNGSIYSNNDIYINSAIININQIKNILFDINILDKELNRKIFDFFYITNYNLINKLSKNKIVLENADIKIKSLFIKKNDTFVFTEFNQKTNIY